MTLLSWDIPLISFNGSLWDVLLRCSKWLLGAWLDSFTMILRCLIGRLSQMSPPPCLYDTVIPELCQLKSGSMKGRPISWAVLHHWKSMGQILVPSLPPRGATFTPFWGYGLTEPASPLQMLANFTFLWNPLSELRGSNFFSNVKSMGQLWDALPPRGATFTPFEVWVLQSLPASSQCGNFKLLWKSTLWATRRQSFSPCFKSMRLILPLFCPLGQTLVPPDRL